MDAAANQSWFLRKHVDGSVFGPLRFEEVRRWADGAQVAPHDKISRDQEIWQKAPMYPELGMDWLVEITSDRYYGPTTLGAVREFIRLGEIGEETFVINSCDGSRRQIGELAELAQEPNDTFELSANAPPATPMSINIRDRITDLEHSLFEERRAFEELEERYRELEARYQALLARDS